MATVPSISLPLVSETFTEESLPCSAVTFSAPLVATDLAPSFGAIDTTAFDGAVLSAAAGLPPPPLPSSAAPSPPEPQAVSATSIAPSRRLVAPRVRLARTPTDAPDIGRPFTVFLPRTACPQARTRGA